MIVTIDLPFPPSQNSIWKVGKSRSGKRIVYRSKPYMRWLREADAQWLVQKPRGRFKTIDGPFTIRIMLSRPDKRSRDCDNMAKAPIDFLQRVGIIKNDSLSEETRVGWVEDSEAPMGMRVVVNY